MGQGNSFRGRQLGRAVRKVCGEGSGLGVAGLAGLYEVGEVARRCLLDRLLGLRQGALDVVLVDDPVSALPGDIEGSLVPEKDTEGPETDLQRIQGPPPVVLVVEDERPTSE